MSTRSVEYGNFSKFSDRLVRANSADPDQTTRSGSALFAIPTASFRLITIW